jgi:hypothetical protein
MIKLIDWSSKQGLGFAVILCACGLSILWLFIDLPFSSKLLSWGVLLVVGFPLYALLEGLGGEIFSLQRGERISRKRFSWKRIGYGLILQLMILGLAFVLHYLMKTGVPFIRAQ